MIKKIIFRNIVFHNIKKNDFNKYIKQKKLFVFPSGSGIPLIDEDKKYYLSLKNADFVFFDSGFFVLLLSILKNIKVDKFSGFKFLYIFFNYLNKNKNKKIFCIDPNPLFSKSNQSYFKKIGVKNIYSYVAPNYNTSNLVDKKLIKKINKVKPDYILTNIGGGTQEILGLYLKKNLKNKTTIICTGGAISFFTGDQAPINKFIDKIYLGWLLRLIFNPLLFYPRYLYALRLFPMVLFNKVKAINE